jgi:hypothetical protein
MRRTDRRIVHPADLVILGHAGPVRVKKIFRPFPPERIRAVALKSDRFQPVPGQTPQNAFNGMRTRYKVPRATLDARLLA